LAEDATSEAGIFKLDATKKPKQMDTVSTEKEVMLGIYELEGDSYKVCFAPVRKPRPSEFASKSGPAITDSTQRGKEKERRTMNPSLQLRKAIPLFLVEVIFFALSPAAQAVSPPPDGGYPGQNTAEGEDALFSLTTGDANTAIGFDALFSNTTGGGNTAVGFNALLSNTTGTGNTATGYQALPNTTDGNSNTANGAYVLFDNTSGGNNTGIGYGALSGNTTGFFNTATGSGALSHNRRGSQNTA
jgi:hypothetical protein